MDEADIAEVGRHLVDKERRPLPVDQGVLKIDAPHLLEFVARQPGQDSRIMGRSPGARAVAELLHQLLDVRQLERAVDQAVRGEDLFDECGARPRHADHEDRVGSRAAPAGPLAEEVA